MALIDGFDDPRIIRRFGNLTATSTSEVLVCARTYNAQSSQAQRSVKSSSANDSNPSGSGAKAIRIEYLDSNYNLKFEDVTLNGTTAVNTVATDIRFIQDMYVIKGAAAAGVIELFPNTGGTGTAICGIPSASEQAFFCHHYIPAGYQGWLLKWSAVSDDEVNLKLKVQKWFNGNLVDWHVDLEKMFAGNPTPPTRLAFERQYRAIHLEEKTYVRTTVVPNQSTSTTIRATIELLLEPIPV